MSVVKHLLLVATAFGIPGAALWEMERRRGSTAARWGLVLLTAACAASLAASAGVLGALAVTVVLWVAAYGYGSLAARWLDLGDACSSWEDVPLVAAMGLAVFVLLAILAGVAGVLSRPVIGAISLVGVALAILNSSRMHVHCRSGGREPAGSPAATWWWGLVVLMLIGMVGAVAPEVRHDALTAHLPVAREFAQQRAIVEMRQQIQSYLPLNAHILYAAGMLFAPGEAAPKLMHYAAGVHAGMLTYGLGARLFTPWVGLASAAILVSTPLIYWTGGTAYTDLWSVLFVVAALAALVCFMERPSCQRALATGVLTGTLLGFKLTNLIVALPVTVVLALVGGLSSGRLKTRLGLIGSFTLGAVVTGSIWYGRAWVLTGNPVFPMLNAVFKSPFWSLENTKFNMHLFGMGTSLWDLVRLPWNVSLHPTRFVEDGSIGLIYLLLLPFALLAIARRRIAPWACGVLLAGGLVWFFNAQYLRYLLPLLPLAAIIGAAGLLDRARHGKGGLRLGVVLLAAAMMTAVTWITPGSPAFPTAVVRGTVTRADYTAAHVAGFRVAEYVRRTLPQSARIYGAGEDMAFYYDRFFVPISWLGRIYDPALPDAVLGARTGAEIQTVLKRAGFSHLVLNRDYPVITRWRRAGGWLAREAPWEEGPRLEYAYGEYYLFQLSPPAGAQVRRGQNLLRNPEMAPDPAGVPAGWGRHGAVSVVQAAGGLEGAGTLVRLAPGAHLVQRVVATPYVLYVLESRIRSMGPSGATRLFIQWLDDRGRVIDHPTWRRIKIGPNSTRYAMACTAPNTARLAQVWLMAEPDGNVEIDNAYFYELR
ncbi:MAG: hypothetical protein FJX73_07385 [Armatimonadetes bacterium]|nr:hypothetical protein [Armatimonadota bacterium]